MTKADTFRQLIASEPYVYTCGIYSPIQARIAEAVGLKCAYMSGYSCALGYLGRADLGFPSMTEMTTWARYIANAVDIPIIADADDGYGNALITMRTIEEYQRSGVAAVHLEDQRLPKRCGHLAGKYCMPVEESVMKLKAALDARAGPDPFIIARTDAYGAVRGSLEEAIERSRRYADAGADMVWAEFPTPDRGDAQLYADTMRREFPGLPLAFNYSSSFRWTQVENPLSFKELGEMGYKLMLVSMGGIHAAMYGEWNFMQDLVENQEHAQLRLQTLKQGHPTENHHLMGQFERFQGLEEKYLPGDMVQERYGTTQGFGARDFRAKDVL